MARADQLLASQGLDVAGNERPGVLRQQVNRGLGGELLADHGGPGDHSALARPETIQPRRQQRRDRRGDRELGLEATPFCEHGDELLDEKRVPIGGLSTRTIAAGARPRARLAISASQSGSGRRSSTRELAFDFPRPQPGRSSRSSGRAMQTTRIGAPCTRSARYSTKSRNVVSAQCRSSKKTTRGRSRASASNRLRVAQKISSRSLDASAAPIASWRLSASGRASCPSARSFPVGPAAVSS